MSSVFEAVLVSSVMASMFFALIRGWYTPETVVFVSMLVVWNVGIISTPEALSGFNNPSLLVIGALFVVVASIENSRLADKASRRVFGVTNTLTSGFFRLMLCAVAMSSFVNNTPVVALLIPVTRDWARARGFDHALLLMPLAFVCSFGGMLTTVGGGTNLLVQGLLYQAGKSDDSIRPFGFFEPGFVGLPLAIAGIGYLLVAAPRLLGAPGGVSGTGRSRDRSEDLLTEVEITRDFELVGQPFALVLATLGLPEDTLVKVRRRCSEGNQEDKPFALSGASLPAAYGGGRVDVPDQGDDKSSGLSWADRIGGGAAAVVASATAAAGAGSSRGVDGIIPFALRRRPPYHRLGTNAGGERPDKLSEAAVPCIEMATIKTSEITDVTAGKEAPTLSKSTRSNGREDSHPLGDVYNVAPKATVRAGDILVLSCDGDAMVRFQGSVGSRRRKGLKVLGISTLKLARHGTVFLKLVLSRSSEFLGRTARAENPFFSARYGCSVVAFRLKGGTGGGVDLIGSNPETPIRTSSDDLRCPTDLASETACLPTCGRDNNVATPTNFVDGVDEALIVSKNDPPKPVRSPLHSALPTPLLSSPGDGGSPTVGASPPREAALPPRRRRREGFEAGDVVMVLTNEGFLEQTSSKREFLSMERVGRLPEPIGWFHFGPLVIFAAMLAWVLVGDVGMVRAGFAACAVLILGGWVDAKQAVRHINWSLLLLIGSALGFSKAIANSGLADYAGEAVKKSGMSPSASLFVLFGVTMVCTALISNNAAAALNTPVALSMARQLEVDYKPLTMAVLLAASCSFLTPIGTPPNTMVWAPGGYKFQEYAKLGGPLSLFVWAVASVVIPLVFPF